MFGTDPVGGMVSTVVSTAPAAPDPSIDVTDEDIVCAVCSSGDVEPDNQIVICEICDLSVHQACYGISTVPTDEWLCAVCEHHMNTLAPAPVPAPALPAPPKSKSSATADAAAVSAQSVPSVAAIKAATLALKCGACQVAGGALKPMHLVNGAAVAAAADDPTASGAGSGTGLFAHVICGYYMPGLNFADPELMQPIVGLEAVDKRRFVCGFHLPHCRRRVAAWSPANRLLTYVLVLCCGRV